MKYILDASVALKWVLKEPESVSALALREKFRQNIHELLAPDTFLAEVAHALTRAERRGIIQLPRASVFFGDIISTAPEIHSFVPLIPRAIEISSKMRLGVYDCLYVALAEREQCELITADARLMNSLPGYPIVSLDSL